MPLRLIDHHTVLRFDARSFIRVLHRLVAWQALSWHWSMTWM